MTASVIIAVLLVVLAAALLGSRNTKWGEVTIPMPKQPRDGLNYVYYLSTPGMLAKVADHTNLLWHAQFYDSATLEAELQGYPHKLVLDCNVQLFDRAPKASVSKTAAADLHNYFTDLSARGLLSRVSFLVPKDEPNLFCASELELRKGLDILKQEAATWPELANVQYACIYGLHAPFMALDEFNLVAVDNYDQRSEVLTKGAHADLMAAISPTQKVFVVPGAAYGQKPEAFVAYAHSTPQVWGVVPFIYSHIPESADKEGWIGLEKRSPADQEAYRQAGLQVLNRTVV